MKKTNLLLILLVCFALSASAQRKFSVYAIGFYNLENLFDTCHDVGKNDHEFLPSGSYRWSGLKYSHKLRNMARAVADMGTERLPGLGCAVIGVSEVENEKCLRDLCNQDVLKARNMQYILLEGPDMRGVDVGLLYNPGLFTPTDTTYHYYYKKDLEAEAQEEAEAELALSKDEDALKDNLRWEDVSSADEMPKFDGGLAGLMEWLKKEIKYPKEAMAAEKEGRVLVQFVVDKDGNVETPKLLRGVDPLLDAEALRVVGDMPKWQPGRKDGEPVRVKYTLPVSFYLDNSDLPKGISHTRGFLTITGKMAGETVTFIVCHWPSRFSGSERRVWAGEQVRKIKDDLLRQNPDNKIFVMGDLNDDPTDKSVTKGLGAKSEIKETGDEDMFNPWYNTLSKHGQGTLAYNGSWNLFDQIILTPNLLDRKGNKDYTNLTYWRNQIQRRDYLIQTEGKYKGNPKRTHAGGVWLDGFSDHLPVVVYLLKEQK